MIGIPLAAGAFIKLFGWELNPMFGAAAMSLSSFCVVTNTLRLNLVKIYDTRRDKKRKGTIKELEVNDMSDQKRDFTLKIEGMMCPHCEAAVKKCLEEFPEVREAVASHEKGTAVIYLDGELEHLEDMKRAITDKGYKVV